MLENIKKVFKQIRQMEKKSVIIGLIIFVSVFYLLVTPTLANVAYGEALQEKSQEEGYENVDSWRAALQEIKNQEAGSSGVYILELDGYITEEDKKTLQSYEKGLAAAKSFAEFNEIYASRENWLSEKRLNKENSEKIEEALLKGADFDIVDWSVGKDAFLEEWTQRINVFLEGSRLEGYGYNFAIAAWNYCVDPRWSPAISFIESGKGKSCFRPYNAWGWGNIGWSSWDESIDAHVYGLSANYGYTITKQLAKRYCPPTWSNWYWCVSSTMETI